jgi:hypothetical protein
MRVIALVVAVGACAYAPERVGTSDLDAAPGTDDGAIVTPDGEVPTWTVVETMTIDSASPDPQRSQTTLTAGGIYRLRVSGVITNVIGEFQGDADYFDFADPKDDGCCEDIGLGIDDVIVNDKDTKPDWGPYRPDHIYEAPWVGTGATIIALFQDTFYGNNIGNLTLEILALQ